MNLLEHQAKSLLADAGAPIPRSWFIKDTSNTPSDVTFPIVVKSQVPVGGRGKAGGIVVVNDESALPDAISTVLGLDIKGHRPSGVLLETALEIKRELYLSLRMNRDTRALEWLVSPRGGIEIEANADTVQTVAFGDEDQLATKLGVQAQRLTPLVEVLKHVFTASDLLLLEINPLAELADGSLVCADAKVLVDDNARFRHPELPWPPAAGNPPKPLGGTIGCIANGAGMAMSTMDTIVAAGGRPANFLDIGGGTGEKEFVEALSAIIKLPDVSSVIINIFAGITRCDEIARGIIAASTQLNNLPPLYIRLEGTNRDEAVALLEAANIAIEPDLATCVRKAMESNS